MCARDLAFRVVPEHALVEGARLLVDLRKLRPALRPARLLGIGGREVHPCVRGELFDRLAEAASLELHDELDRVARDPAAEAVEHLLVGHDVEARRLLAVERAQPFPVVPALLERDAPLHDLHDIRAIAELLKLLVGN